MRNKCLPGDPFAVLRLLVLLTVIFQAQTLDPNRTAPKVPAVIVFGDSLVDPGNNNELLTIARCNFPPYGKDFLGHQATGRFSNGKIPSDWIASELGVKEYVPAYVGTTLDAKDLLTGVCFASGGCGYDPLTARLVTALSLSDQVALFKDYKQKLKGVAGERRAAKIIADSLYAVVAGTNDIATTYFISPFRRAEFDLPSYIHFLVQSASNFIQELYHLGARKIGVMGVPPIGCLPSQRTLAGGIERECVALYNQASTMFNSELSVESQRLHYMLPGSKIIYIDIYTPLLDMIFRPFAYGFKVSTRGCCGTGTFEVIIACNSLLTSTCDNVSEYVFWDSFHLTERANQIISRQVVQRYGPIIL